MLVRVEVKQINWQKLNIERLQRYKSLGLDDLGMENVATKVNNDIAMFLARYSLSSSKDIIGDMPIISSHLYETTLIDYREMQSLTKPEVDRVSGILFDELNSDDRKTAMFYPSLSCGDMISFKSDTGDHCHSTIVGLGYITHY